MRFLRIIICKIKNSLKFVLKENTVLKKKNPFKIICVIFVMLANQMQYLFYNYFN